MSTGSEEEPKRMEMEQERREQLRIKWLKEEQDKNDLYNKDPVYKEYIDNLNKINNVDEKIIKNDFNPEKLNGGSILYTQKYKNKYLKYKKKYLDLKTKY